jgi:SEC-C motif-containing protein
MRSRYTAYTLAKISYIKSTQSGPAADTFASASALRWAKSCKWLGLSIDLDNTTLEFWNSDTAKVGFTANFEQAGAQRTMSEVSIFKKIAGKWYYCSHE